MTTFKSLVFRHSTVSVLLKGIFVLWHLLYTGLAFGEPPGQYHFAQEKMRRHLWSCFERRQISMFPYIQETEMGHRIDCEVSEVPAYSV